MFPISLLLIPAPCLRNVISNFPIPSAGGGYTTTTKTNFVFFSPVFTFHFYRSYLSVTHLFLLVTEFLLTEIIAVNFEKMIHFLHFKFFCRVFWFVLRFFGKFWATCRANVYPCSYLIFSYVLLDSRFSCCFSN